jgi:cyclopropane fatty-acyl-phospholipid synthase-like methyltransferase
MRFAGVSDEEWLRLNVEGAVAGVPDEQLQAHFVGLAGEDAFKDGFRIYQLVRRLYERHAAPLDDSTRVLDFGCGWGRIARFFLRETEELWGIDVSERVIEVCRHTIPRGTFQLTERFGPSVFAEASFDLVYAYSVFSHLSETCHASWIADFARILRPGGVLVATTRPREFVEREVREPKEALAAYDAGEYCYYESHGFPDFGLAAIPESYVRERWSNQLEVVEFIADREVDDQNVAVATRPG